MKKLDFSNFCQCLEHDPERTGQPLKDFCSPKREYFVTRKFETETEIET
jgi:hypothetical protein